MKLIPVKARYPLFVCSAITMLLAISQLSCKKTDFIAASQQNDFTEKFFITSSSANPEIRRLAALLERQNDRRNFVNALPGNIGLPLWSSMKILQVNAMARDSVEEGFMLIPFSTSGAYLDGLLIAIPETDTSYLVKYYGSTFLYGVCHKTNKNIAQAENLLGLFMIMENYLFNRTDFYHVPVDVFRTNARNVSADSTKTASLTNLDNEGGGNTSSIVISGCSIIPSGVHHPNEEGPCDWKDQCEYCSALYCITAIPDLPDPPTPPGGGGGNWPPTTPPPTPPTGGGGGGNCTGCPEPPTDCRMPFYIEDTCEPEPVPTDTIPTSEILQLLHDENVDIKKQRDSVWDSAFANDVEYHFFIKRTNRISKTMGIRTDHKQNAVDGDRMVEVMNNPDGSWHTHQDHPNSFDRHPHDPQDIAAANLKIWKPYFRNYVDCGDTLYVIVSENLSKMKSSYKVHEIINLQYSPQWRQLETVGNRRSIGLSLLLLLVGNSSTTGLGLYKSVNADKTVFIKVN